jgi:hypothetical protein
VLFPFQVQTESRRRIAGGALVVAILAALFVWFAGSRNPYTPAGYVGYLTKGAVMGKSRFYGVQRGPTSAAGPGCWT